MPQAAFVGSPVSHLPEAAAISAAMGVLAGSNRPGLLAAAYGGLLGGTDAVVRFAMGGEGVIVRGSDNVITNGRPAARVLDPVTCHLSNAVSIGSNTVFINGLPAARVTDPTFDGAIILGGSPNVIIGGGRTGAPDVPGVPPPCLMAAATAASPFVLPS